MTQQEHGSVAMGDSSAARKELVAAIHEWERNREFLNCSPDSKDRFIERKAASLAAALSRPVQEPVAEKLRLAVAAVLESDKEFRAQMMPGWDGDPLTDELDGLRRIFEALPAPQPAHGTSATERVPNLGVEGD